LSSADPDNHYHRELGTETRPLLRKPHELTYFPADGVPGERFGELHGFHFGPGTQFVAPQYYDLRREDAEGLVGGGLGTWQRREYTAANLERRGAQVIPVRPGDI
jgi:hypothetical protein